MALQFLHTTRKERNMNASYLNNIIALVGGILLPLILVVLVISSRRRCGSGLAALR